MHMEPAQAKQKEPKKFLSKLSTPYLPAVNRILKKQLISDLGSLSILLQSLNAAKASLRLGRSDQ